MSIFSSLNLTSRQPSKVLKYYHKPHVVFQKGPRNLAATIDPEVVDRFGLVAGLDVAHFRIEGDKVVLTFTRRGGALET